MTKSQALADVVDAARETQSWLKQLADGLVRVPEPVRQVAARQYATLLDAIETYDAAPDEDVQMIAEQIFHLDGSYSEVTKKIVTIITAFAARSAKPDEDARAVGREVVTKWLGCFDPPPQITFTQSEFLQQEIAAAITARKREMICPKCREVARNIALVEKVESGDSPAGWAAARIADKLRTLPAHPQDAEVRKDLIAIIEKETIWALDSIERVSDAILAYLHSQGWRKG